MRNIPLLIALSLFGASASGCVLLAGAGLGVMAHDEATENDGEFDPLEDVEKEIDEEF